jgi:excisionase family DNA binding protein
MPHIIDMTKINVNNKGVNMEKLLLKPNEVTQILGLGRSKVYELLSSRQLPVIKIGRCIRIPKTSLEDWIKNNEINPIKII